MRITKKLSIVSLFCLGFILGTAVAYAVSWVTYNGNASSGWSGTGTFNVASGTGHGYDGTLYWGKSNQSPSLSAAWRPEAPYSSFYDVSVYVPNYYTTAPSVKYSVAHNNGQSQVLQVSNYNQVSDVWIKLGNFYKKSGYDFAVFMGSSNQPSTNEYIAWDEVRLYKP